MTKKSVFGRGLVINLVKFAEHFGKLYYSLEDEKRWIEKNPTLFSEEHAIQMWANGASDHLYEIKVPRGKDWDEIRGLVIELQAKGLDMGHGSGLMGTKTFTKEDAEKFILLLEVMLLTRQIALKIDEKIGLKPNMGVW